MSANDDVRSPASGVRRANLASGGRSIRENELDLVVGSLTDVSPSLALKANVMRRIAEGRVQGSAVRPWRLALASAAILLVAASTWLVLRPGSPTEPVRTRVAGRDVTLPPGTVSRGGAEVLPGTATAPSRSAGSAVPHLARASTRVAAAHPRVTTIDEMVIAPLAQPDPIAVPLLTVDAVELERMEIAPLQVGPVDSGDIRERRD